MIRPTAIDARRWIEAVATGLLFVAMIVVTVGGWTWIQHRREVNRRFELALYAGNPGEMAHAVEGGADAFRRPRRPGERSAVMFAVDHDERRLLKLLLDHGAPIDDPESYRGDTPLMYAASLNADVVPLLLDRGADPNLLNRHGRTALMCAVAYGHERAVQSLLEHSANPDTADSAGRTALAYAAILDRGSSIKLLLAHGADPDRAGVAGYRPLEWLLADGHWRTAALLRKGCRTMPSTEAATLIGACKVGDLKRALDALDRGASANAVSVSGARPLLIAIWNKDTAMVRLLLEHGASPLASGRKRRLDWPNEDYRYASAESGNAFDAARHVGWPDLLRMFRDARRERSARDSLR